MSGKIDDGGPAFPTAADNGHSTNQDGMSLRDYFAAAALQGFLSNQALATIHQSELAKGAYEYADAMIEARKKGGA
jgi:hypothetical protein